MRPRWFAAIIGGGLVIAIAAAWLDDPSSSPAPPNSASHKVEAPGAGGFQFIRTTFDDGWVAIVQPKWVEVTKGDIRLLLHYPADVKAANTDPDVMATAAWNALVAPRYRDLRNYKTLGSVLNYERPYMAQGDLTDSASGAPRFVAIFQQGDTDWIEIVSPDRATFTANFGVDVERINNERHGNAQDTLKALRRLGVYNKFAVAPADLPGKWTTNFSANTFYVNTVTGRSAGMSTYSSGTEYEFSGQNYKWRLAAANSTGGRTSFQQGKAEGTFTMPDNWSIRFSDIGGQPRTYPVQFRAVQGGRILMVDGTAFVRAP